MKNFEVKLPRVYLAGPMTGYKDHNFPAFKNYTKWLRNHGYDVVSPEELENKETGDRKSWEYYLTRDLRELLTCGSIAVLPGWEKSRGATLEVYVGWRLGFSIFDARDFELVDVTKFDFSSVQNSAAFMRAFAPPIMKRSIADVAAGVDKLMDKMTADKVREWETLKGLAADAGIKPKPENILKEADRIVGGDRAAAYGHPREDFARTAQIWSAILGITVPVEKVALCMVGVKMSRQCNAAKRDNWVDMAGYAQTGYMVDQKDGRME